MTITSSEPGSPPDPEDRDPRSAIATSGREQESMLRQQRELTSNQWWEMLGTAAKALFVLGVTPVLLHRLGADGYGAFAIALSTMVSVIAFDFGIRMRLRVALSELASSPSQPAGSRALARAFGHYSSLLILLIGAAAVLVSSGGWQRWTKTSGALLLASVTCSAAFGLSLLLLEPLAARGRLSRTKAAAFFGNIIAIPVLLGLTAAGATALDCMVGYALSLTIPNLVYAFRAPVPEVAGLPQALGGISPAGLFGSLYAGRWFALTAAEWMTKSYLLTFLAGALLGPAAAGTYFILLKMSEFVSVFGASASDTSTADLAALPDPRSRAENLRASYSYSASMCLTAFASLACLGPLVFGRWLHLPMQDPLLAILAGTFGLVAAFHRVVLTACMGVSLTHLAALWSLGEIAIVLGGSILLVPRFGLAGILIAGTLSGLAFLPIARGIAHRLGEGAWRLWVHPVLPLAPAFLAAAGCAWLGGALGLDWLQVIGFFPAAATTVHRIWFRKR